MNTQSPESPNAGDARDTGETVIESHEQGERVIGELLAGARRRILVLGPVIELDCFRREDTADRLARFVAVHRYNEVRILLDRADEFTVRHPRLVTVYRRLSPLIDIRCVPESFLPLDETFLTTDTGGYYRQRLRGRARPTAMLSAPGVARELARSFDSLWPYGEAVPSLATTGLR